MWKLDAEAVEAVTFLWKRKQTRKRVTLYGAGSGIKKYSTASTSLHNKKAQRKFKNHNKKSINKMGLG